MRTGFAADREALLGRESSTVMPPFDAAVKPIGPKLELGSRPVVVLYTKYSPARLWLCVCSYRCQPRLQKRLSPRAGSP